MSFNSINSFLDKAVSVANAAASAAGKKTEEVVETSKLKLRQASLNSEISCCYEQLGKMVYEANRFDVPNEENQTDMMAQIDALLNDLSDLQAKKEEISKVKKCPNCGASCPTDSHFCSRCGMMITPRSEDEEYTEEAADDDFMDTVEDAVEDAVDAAADKIKDTAEEVKEKVENDD